MSAAPSRYPLAWPTGWPRAKHRRSAAFKVDYDKALRDLGAEIERLGGRYPVMSTNMELRLDGQPRRDKGEPNDTGVAVYFELKGQQKVFACDTFNRVKDNIRGICLTIEALRAISRFGASDMLERALTAFDALPAPNSQGWREVLAIPPGAPVNRDAIDRAYRQLAAVRHPDKGGSNDAMAKLNAARDAALREVAA